MAFTPRSAKNAKVRLGAVIHYCYEWTVTPKTDIIDSTSMESAGYFEWIPGIVRVDGNIKALYDAQSSPYDSPSSLTVGASISSLKCYINDTSGAYWNITTAKISEAPVMANVKEGVKFDFNFTGSGTFTYPTGAS